MLRHGVSAANEPIGRCRELTYFTLINAGISPPACERASQLQGMRTIFPAM